MSIDSTPEADTQEVYADELAPARRSGGGLGSALLILTGFAASAGTVAMLNAQHFSWQLVHFSRDLEVLGISKGSLLMGGLILIGIGMVLRATSTVSSRVAAPAVQLEPKHDRTGVELENLQSSVIRLLQAVDRSEQKLTSIQTGHGRLFEQLATLAEASQATSQDGGNQSDAVFRLAASMDKLGRQLDESIQRATGPLAKAIENVTTGVELQLAAFQQTLFAEPEPEFHETRSSRQAPAPVEDELTVVVNLEADEEAYEPEPEPFVVEELGLLDQLDDFGNFEPQAPAPSTAAAPKPAPHGGLPVLDFDQLAARSEGPPAALPRKAEPKLDLDALLPDDRVDEAIKRRRQG